MWLDVCRHLYNNMVVLTQGTNSMNEPRSCLAVKSRFLLSFNYLLDSVSGEWSDSLTHSDVLSFFQMCFRNPGGVLSLPHSLVYPLVRQKLKSK